MRPLRAALGALRILALWAVVLCAAASSAAPAAPPARRGGTPTGQHPPQLEADIDARMQQIVTLLYSSRLGEARQVADAAVALAPQDPRVHLMQARILRESFPDQSSTGENLEVYSSPIQAELDRVVQICDTLQARDPQRAAAYLYRGWARLFAAQIHTLCDEIWSAGRDAKRGKADLDQALLLEPGNTDGQGILGTYLYFADVLPRVIKLARILIGIPGGDKRLGLEMMRASAAGGGYNHLDAQALLGAIALGFEGDYRGGRRVFETMLKDFPDNPRLVEPLAALDLFEPENAQLERTARVAEADAAHPLDWYRQLSQRLTFYRSITELVLGHADEAIRHMDTVRAAGPTEPDWFPNDVLLCLLEMRALGGERPAAQPVPQSGRNAQQVTALLHALERPGGVATAEEAATFQRTQEAARALYGGDRSRARRILDGFGASDDPGVNFYQGELARLSGDARAARARYERLTERSLPDRWRLLKTLAFSRRAELEGTTAPAAAAALLRRAIEFDEDRDLLRHLLRSRQRYYDLLANGGEGPAAASDGQPPPDVH